MAGYLPQRDAELGNWVAKKAMRGGRLVIRSGVCELLSTFAVFVRRFPAGRRD
jgi:hypothetical protein